LKELFTFRWQPGKDLAAVIVSGSWSWEGLYTASIIVGQPPAAGCPTSSVCRDDRHPVWSQDPAGLDGWHPQAALSDLGITTRRLGLSLIIQVIWRSFCFSADSAR
jgi:hypothetical protein